MEHRSQRVDVCAGGRRSARCERRRLYDHRTHIANSARSLSTSLRGQPRSSGLNPRLQFLMGRHRRVGAFDGGPSRGPVCSRGDFSHRGVGTRQNPLTGRLNEPEPQNSRSTSQSETSQASTSPVHERSGLIRVTLINRCRREDMNKASALDISRSGFVQIQHVLPSGGRAGDRYRAEAVAPAKNLS